MCADASSTVRVLTPIGRGAVATLHVEGLAVVDEAPPLFEAANGAPLLEQEINRVCFGRWGHEAQEEIVVCRVAEDVVEIHCHGGAAAVERVVTDLESRGCVRLSDSHVTWPVPASDESGDFRPPLAAEVIEAECRDALARATTLRTADILWQQCEGRLASALAELESLPSEVAKRRAEGMLRWAEFGSHLTKPWQVVVCGRPNVGKSSLINALVGYGRSIVFDEPGTTRDVVSAETALDGWPIEFSDTAGLRDDADELEAVGIEKARKRLQSADLRILLFDTSEPPHVDDRRLLTEWPDALVVAHKCDLPNQWNKLPQKSVLVSSLAGDGVNELAAEIVTRLVRVVPPPTTALPVTARQIDVLKDFSGPPDH